MHQILTFQTIYTGQAMSIFELEKTRKISRGFLSMDFGSCISYEELQLNYVYYKCMDSRNLESYLREIINTIVTIF